MTPHPARPLLAWHFAPSATHLRGGLPWAVGVEEVHDGPLALCASGLHASTDPLDALAYAPGPWVRRVSVGGEIVRGADKVVCSRRTPLWGYDATEVLRAFAHRCAPTVLTAASDTAWAVARAVALDAADAAVDAAMDTAPDAAWDAACRRQSRRLARMLMAGRPR